jgi:hypothetical protein
MIGREHTYTGRTGVYRTNNSIIAVPVNHALRWELTGITRFIAYVLRWHTGIAVVFRTCTAAAGIIAVAEDSIVTGSGVISVHTTQYCVAAVIGTGIAVIAGSGVISVHTTQHCVAGIIGAGIAVIAGSGVISVHTTQHCVAGIIGTGIAVIAGSGVISVHTTQYCVAGIIGAGIAVIAVQRGAPFTVTGKACFTGGAGIPVITGSNVVGP